MEPLRPLTRRQLLLGGGGLLLLTACGGNEPREEEDDEAGSLEDESTETTDTTPGAVSGGLVLYRVFAPSQPVGVDLRLPLALASAEGDLDIDLPPSVTVRLRPPEGATASGPTEIELRDEGIPRGYYPLRTRFDEPGRWGIVVEAGDVRVETTVDARPASELPAVPAPGDALPAIPTPTVDQPRGVDPICTREPPCPFHERSLDEAIGGGGPIVLLVSTPAFCQTAICGPVLDLLVDRRRLLEEAGATVIHAEVYVDERAQETTPAVDALGLTYEPALFLAAPDGTVTDRLDYTFDGSELDEAISRLLP